MEKKMTLEQLIEAVNYAKLDNVVAEQGAEDNNLNIYINSIDPYIMVEPLVFASIDKDGDITLSSCSENRLQINMWYHSVQEAVDALRLFDKLTGDREKDVKMFEDNNFEYIDYKDEE